MLVGDKSPLVVTQEAAGQARIEAAVADLVAFAEGKPTPASVRAKMEELANSVLVPSILEIVGILQFAVSGASDVEKAAFYKKADELMTKMRTAVQAGKKFEDAQRELGIGTGQVGGLLASAAGNPLKMDLVWAMMRMSVAAAAPQMQSGQQG
jgi:hypothetical protein